MDEITSLLAILKDHRRLAIGKARGEIGQNTGIGIGKRLSGAEYVKQA
jgi:hypothetical protein